MRSATFLAPAYVSRARVAGNSEAVNLFFEASEAKGTKSPGCWYQTPGLDLLVSVAVGPERGSIVMAGTLYVVSGSGFYSLDQNYNETLLGNVTNLLTPVSMITNGTQIAIFDGTSGFVYQSAQPATASVAAITASFNPIDLPFNGPVIGTYQDGFGLVNEAGTDAWWQSNLLDLTTWQPLNFSTVDAQPDNVTAIKSLKRECWLIKQTDTEIWINAGNPGFAFQRLEGVFIESGIIAPYSLAKCGDSEGGSRLAWLSADENGQGVIVATAGYQLQRISNHYIERRIQAMSSITDATAYSYQQEGHLFYVINFTAGNETWAYDFTVSAQIGEPCWHRRASFVSGQWARHWGNNHVFAYGQHIIGDYRNGNLYAYDLNQPLDNGSQRRWLRSWRALPQPTDDPTRFDSLQIDMQTGIGVTPGTNPQVVLRWSDDGGFNWPVTRYASAGQVGETAQRVIFQRLGSTKRGAGQDRTFELSSSDVFGVALVGADMS